MSRHVCVGLALATMVTLAPNVVHAEDHFALAPLRFGLGGTLGVLAARPDPPIYRNQNGYDGVPFSAGFGVDGRAGVQLLPFLAIDLQVVAETAVLAADARASALLEISPVRSFALAAGWGVGAMWTANFFFTSPSATFATWVGRAEVRLPTRGDEWFFGLEGTLGHTHRGTVPEGTQVIGGRGFVGFLFR